MIALWIVVICVILGAIAAARGWSHGRGQPDLGFVSHQWLAEHRLAQTQDSQR